MHLLRQRPYTLHKTQQPYRHSKHTYLQPLHKSRDQYLFFLSHRCIAVGKGILQYD